MFSSLGPHLGSFLFCVICCLLPVSLSSHLSALTFKKMCGSPADGGFRSVTSLTRRTDKPQAGFSSVVVGLSALSDLTLGHQDKRLTDVPLQPHSSPDWVFRTASIHKHRPWDAGVSVEWKESVYNKSSGQEQEQKARQVQEQTRQEHRQLQKVLVNFKAADAPIGKNADFLALMGMALPSGPLKHQV